MSVVRPAADPPLCSSLHAEKIKYINYKNHYYILLIRIISKIPEDTLHNLVLRIILFAYKTIVKCITINGTKQSNQLELEVDAN